MARNKGLKSTQPKLWVFYVQYSRTETEIVFGTFFGRFPERSKIRKMQLETRRKDTKIVYTGYTNDINDYRYYVWPVMIQKPKCLEEIV